jgi:origin recognition complex subunit 5
MTVSPATVLSLPESAALVYIHHPHHPSTLLNLPSSSSTVTLDLIEYHTPRLLYSGVLSRLGAEAGEISTWDDFARHLRHHLDAGSGKGKGKRKADDMESGHEGDSTSHKATGRVVILTHAEKLRSVLGLGWAVMTRLTELVSWLNWSQ